MNTLHAGMIFEEACDRASVRVVLFHPHGQRFYPA